MLQYGLFLVIVALLVKPLGGYLARVFAGERTWLDPLLRPLERAVYKLARVDAQQEMSWQRYANSFVLFSLVGTLLGFLLLRLQFFLPFFARTASYLATPLTPDLAMRPSHFISSLATVVAKVTGGVAAVAQPV